MNGEPTSMPGDTVRLAVVHWFPVEQFPPVQNLLSVASADPQLDVCCLTTANDRGLPSFEACPAEIHRRTFPSRSLRRLQRLWLLLSFPWWALWRLMSFRPDALLYFEPHSSAAAFLYLLINRRCRLLVHYHEYREPKEYRDPGNRLFGFYHWLEKRFLYHRAIWISHTNADRVRLFLKDAPQAPTDKLRVLPNYPPQVWQSSFHKRPGLREPLKLVYVGAASVRDTFIGEVVEWVLQQPREKVSLAVYVNNCDVQTEQLLQLAAESGVVVVPGGVAYQQLPDVLSQYHVGLILYRGNTPNYVYNAPNKLFEYLACGLDVWYPGCMLGITPYARTNAAPRVVETDFEKLELPNFVVCPGLDLPWHPWTDSCENVLQPLLKTIKVRER
jgi:hypothetical protein